jgi:hypothetical protein
MIRIYIRKTYYPHLCAGLGDLPKSRDFSYKPLLLLLLLIFLRAISTETDLQPLSHRLSKRNLFRAKTAFCLISSSQTAGHFASSLNPSFVQQFAIVFGGDYPSLPSPPPLHYRHGLPPSKSSQHVYSLSVYLSAYLQASGKCWHVSPVQST